MTGIEEIKENEAEKPALSNGYNKGEWPTMEYYEDKKKELRDLINKKQSVDRALAALEEKIYKLEGAYLEDTSQGGNIIRGFEGFLKGSNYKKRTDYTDNDRLFSFSSGTFLKFLHKNDSGDDSDTSTSQKKKKRRKLDGDSSGSSKDLPYVSKRVRISFRTDD
ncbi:hypothetical protein T552_01220 [Pneumocystis carinii B80]|uniref:Chromatin modification-related protein EAF6 n=1 Tax=Pneumocystis carinii (strain B80) TaxID=1408658 RepID=A0A0W4ZLL6_PNEC8|nr:hypothetical protein T552_01220 [Pneumocystis carinii B80]KTW29265.1 hypothetical protein T552_01220 [Pneumocystis carinii B80]